MSHKEENTHLNAQSLLPTHSAPTAAASQQKSQTTNNNSIENEFQPTNYVTQHTLSTDDYVVETQAFENEIFLQSHDIEQALSKKGSMDEQQIQEPPLNAIGGRNYSHSQSISTPHLPRKQINKHSTKKRRHSDSLSHSAEPSRSKSSDFNKTNSINNKIESNLASFVFLLSHLPNK